MIRAPQGWQEKDRERANCMCSNPACLRDNWCSVRNCCGRMDEPKSKWAKTDRFSKPISPTSVQRICKGYVPANTGKSQSGP